MLTDELCEADPTMLRAYFFTEATTPKKVAGRMTTQPSLPSGTSKESIAIRSRSSRWLISGKKKAPVTGAITVQGRDVCDIFKESSQEDEWIIHYKTIQRIPSSSNLSEITGR